MTRIIPPYLFLLLLVPLILLWVFHPDQLSMRADAPMPWDIPLIMGVIAVVWARLHFKNRAAEIHTFKEPRTLVTDGPFRFSRNPMYLGFVLILLAGAFFVNTWCALIAPAAFLAASLFLYIPYEEHVLRDKFGAVYDDYSWTTRRWF